MSNQNYALVLDTNRKPLNPCTPVVARSLLKAGKAKVFRRFPFTIILGKAVADKPSPMQLKLDPGLKVTGIALLQAVGHGTRQMCGTDQYGFPIRHRSRIQIHQGFQTGDIVKAIVTNGKKIGTYIGRVLCRASGSFDIATKDGRVQGISHRYCQAIHRKDGYAYSF